MDSKQNPLLKGIFHQPKKIPLEVYFQLFHPKKIPAEFHDISMMKIVGFANKK